MKSPLRVLHLEDNPGDAELIQAVLEGEGAICDVTRVETRAEFVASLDEGGFDLILADYTLPHSMAFLHYKSLWRSRRMSHLFLLVARSERK